MLLFVDIGSDWEYNVVQSGSLIITGTVSEVEAAVNAVLDYVGEKLGFAVCPITRT